MTHPYVALAREAISAQVEGRRPAPALLPAALEGRHPVFVSLHGPDGALRGCIGHLAPSCADLATEIATTAVLAATEDPRFPPLGREELGALQIEVSVLGAPEPIDGPEALDPQRYGVVVWSGSRRGVLLPALDGVDTVAQQVAIARRKAGIRPDEPVHLERFTVELYR